MLLHERDHGRLLEVGDYRHPGAPGDAAAVFNGRDHNGRLAPLS
jgi:hypothetical protein